MPLGLDQDLVFEFIGRRRPAKVQHLAQREFRRLQRRRVGQLQWHAIHNLGAGWLSSQARCSYYTHADRWITYSRLHQDGYTETGSAVALQIGSTSTSSIKSDLGAKLDRSFKTSYGDMTPSAQVSWRHEYQNTACNQSPILQPIPPAPRASPLRGPQLPGGITALPSYGDHIKQERA
jgi:hypothetical protein